MGRGVEGRGRQDKRDWRQGARQASLHIPLTRVAFEGARVAQFNEAVEFVDVSLAPIAVAAS